jgi:hypothetical protein
VRSFERNQRSRGLAKLAGKRERLRSLLIDGVLTSEEYEKDIEALNDAERAVHATFERLRSPGGNFQPFVDAGILVNQASFFFADGTPEEKARLVRDATFNLTLTNKTVLVQAKDSFTIFRDRVRFPTMRAWLDYVETRLTSIEGQSGLPRNAGPFGGS